jgi:hypothetical protein
MEPGELMNNVLSFGVVATLLAVATRMPAPLPSEPIGVFAILDKVVMKPNAEQPTEVELQGAFAVAEGSRGDYYRAPRRGSLRFSAGKKPEEAVAQWRELQKHAGSGVCVALSTRYEQHAAQSPLRVTPPGEPTAPPVPFGPGMGVTVMQNVHYGPVRELELLPRCLETKLAAPGRTEWPYQKVELACENCIAKDKDLSYVFEVETSDGERFASGLVPAGEGKTTWTTGLALQAGEKVTWSVHVTGPGVERAPFDSKSCSVPVATEGR